MKTISYILLLCIVLMLTGCPRNAPNLDLSNGNHKRLLIGQLKEDVFKKEWIEYKCSNDGFYNTGVSNNSFISFLCGDLAQKQDYARTVRNEVSGNSVGIIDDVYSVYIRNIRARRSVGEFVADLVQLGGSASAGFVKGERPLQIIGVFLTAFSGARKSANLNFYDELTTDILIKRMDASRSQILSEIKQNQRKSTADYTFDEALDDIIRYFDAGTLNRAFTDLDRQTSVEAEIARKGVLNVKNLKDISELPSDAEIGVNNASFDSLKSLSNDLKDVNKVKPATAILKTIYEQIEREPQFKDVIADLKAKKMPQYGELSSTTKTNIESAFAKLGATPPTEPTGVEYHSLIVAVRSMTSVNTGSGVVDKPELRKLLLDYINNAKPR